ncbi:MAG: hypothetical protein J0H94_11990 [Rhizobiales bacterium]|nr:hypothetical protein [Hyphomicrobiales bacterium]
MFEALIPILVNAGAPILADVIRAKSPAAAAVVEAIAKKVGTSPTVEDVIHASEVAPADVAKAAQEVEAESPEYWRFMAGAQGSQAELLEREDDREGWFSWAWRPAMCWMLLLLWIWNCILLPLINGATHAGIAMIPWEQLTFFSGLWLAIYGGGHMIQDVAGKIAGAMKG